MKMILLGIAFLTALLVAEETKEKALLAMEKTKFKKALIEEMKSKLEAKSIEITLVEDHKNELKDYKASDFDYVFITNSGVNSKVRPWIIEWLLANNNSDNILLHTTKTKKWKEQVTVDAISSASVPKEAASLADTYIEQLLAKKKSESGK